MKTRVLGTSGIQVSEVGLGCASYWGKPRFDEEYALRLYAVAREQGVNFFDTGHEYSGGNAELRLGKALLRDQHREQVHISSKAGTKLDSNGRTRKDFSVAWLEKSFHLSLKRIGVDSLTVFQLHGPRVSDLNDDVLNFLTSLKTRGLVRMIGVNTFDDDVIEAVAELGIFDCIMIDYNVLRQDRDRQIDRLHNAGVCVLAASALAESLYSNRIFKVRGIRDLWYLARAVRKFPDQIVKGMSFRFLNRLDDMTGAQAALSYVLNNRKVAAAFIGTTSEHHLAENLKASGIELPESLLQKIKAAF